MGNEPAPVDGECNCTLRIGDNYGDGHATMRCNLPTGHEGPHCERFRWPEKGATVESMYAHSVTVMWYGDDAEPPLCEAVHPVDTFVTCDMGQGHEGKHHGYKIVDPPASGEGCDLVEVDWDDEKVSQEGDQR